ncbi:MAG: hypothetical protein QXV17_05015 [Candidatus Micrarchaeaceae archaeon]
MLTYQSTPNNKTYTETIDNINITRLKTSFIGKYRWSWEYGKVYKQLKQHVNIFHLPSGQPELLSYYIDTNDVNICFYH